ncbi:MAG: hypothetical protein AB9836_02735 [Aminipila sp.]
MEGNEENEIKKIVECFYEAFYQSDRRKMFSYLDTSFQKSVPLNYFLIHSDFDVDIGTLLDIHKIRIEKEKRLAFAECFVEFQKGKRKIIIVLKSDFGGWKIDGKSVFKRKL